MPEPAPTDDVVCPIPLAQRAEERCQLNYWAYMVDLLQCLVGLQVLTVPMLLEERILPRLDQLVGQPAFWQAVQAGNAECLELITDLLVTVLQWYARNPDALTLETVKVSRSLLLQVVPLLCDASAYPAVQSVVHGTCQVSKEGFAAILWEI
eukprot:EG_transcript_5450